VLDAAYQGFAWLSWIIGLGLGFALLVIAVMTLRHRRVIMMERDAAERIKAFHDRQP
jgi:hypothetical protein